MTIVTMWTQRSTDADLADWQNPAKQAAMLRSMLQALLDMTVSKLVAYTVAPRKFLCTGW